MKRLTLAFVSLLLCLAGVGRAAGPAAALATYAASLDDALIGYYADPSSTPPAPAVPADVLATLQPAARQLLSTPANTSNYPLAVGRLRGRIQQAMILQLADAVQANRVGDAQAWRVEINLPRGVSSSDGAVLLRNLPAGDAQRQDAVRSLVREAVAWQTARVRILLADAGRAAAHPETPMPGRLMEQLGEAATLAALPPALRTAAGLTDGESAGDLDAIAAAIASFQETPWPDVGGKLTGFRDRVESHLPSLLSDKEKVRRERMLLKLVTIIPKEYVNGVRDGQISTPLEYREAVSFTQQARQFADELAPLWLASDKDGSRRSALNTLEQRLSDADAAIAAKRPPPELTDILKQAQSTLEGPLGISLHRGGTTADIVDEVMLDTRRLLGESLAAANAGNWAEAGSLRLEAYTTYDPDLEARLMPRDPQLATDIEHLLLDGLQKPGVKALLDQRVAGTELDAAYQRVYDALDRAAALLKSGVSPGAAIVNAGSIVLREGLEGLLVIVAILAGLRGGEHRRKRHMIWYGVLLSMVATGVTVVLSQTVITQLRSYAEVIEAVTSILAIGVLLLITNWLFQQIYWRQWVCTLKGQAASDSAWQLITVGFLIGYREGFETVLFLQSMMMDVGGGPIVIGVSIGCALLIALGVAALVGGMKLPYFKLLLGTAAMIGFVLVTFVGTGVRAMQTVGWVPVHKIVSASWPAWTGQWLGVYNSWETLGGQFAAIVLVVGTWRLSRWRSKRAAEAKGREIAAARAANARLSLPQLIPAAAEGARECGLDFNDPLHPCPLEEDEAEGATAAHIPAPARRPVLAHQLVSNP